MASDEELAAWCEAQACRSQREGWDETMRAVAAALRRPAPADGWRPIDFMAVKQCSECSSQLCATAYGMTGVIVVFESQEAAEAYQRAMLDASPPPPARAELVTRLRVVAQYLTDIDEPHYAVPVNEAATALGDT